MSFPLKLNILSLPLTLSIKLNTLSLPLTLSLKLNSLSLSTSYGSFGSHYNRRCETELVINYRLSLLQVNTNIQILLLASSLAAPVFEFVNHPALHLLWGVTAVTTSWSFVSYLRTNPYTVLKKS